MMKLLHQQFQKGLFMLVLFLTTIVSWGQVTIFSENMGTPSGTSAISANAFQNEPALTFAGDADVRTSTGSSGYTDSSGGGNVFLTSSSGRYFTISGINTLNFTALTLSYGLHKSTTASNATDLAVEYSTTGSSWTALTVPAQPTGSGTANWRLITTTGTMPSSTTLSIRFRQTAGATQYRIDDVVLKGTPAASSASTIIKNTSFTEPSNIDYTQYQAANISYTGAVHNSVEVAQFDIRDGGNSADSDALATTLTAISFTVANPGPLRRLAIYDGNTEIAEQPVTSTAGSVTVSFPSFTLTAPDGGASTFGSKTFSLRATFDATVTDNTQLRFTVLSTTENSAGSKFAADNAGAATTSISSDLNTVRVIADRLAFVAQPAATNVNSAMANVTISANDANGSRDLDFTESISITSTGTLTGSPVTSAAVSGLATFSGLTHTTAQDGLIFTATRTSGSDWNVDSNAFNINKISQTITFGALASVTYGDTDLILSSTGGASGEPVTFTSLDETVATVSGNTVIIIGPGQTLITASQAGNNNYSAAADVDQILTVNKKQLTVTAATAENKTYDGNDVATITGATLSGGIVGSDDVSLDTEYLAEFNNKNIGTAKPVEAAFQLAGAQASRYLLADPTGLTANITGKGLSITGIAIADKDFDSTTGATITGTPVLIGVVGSENVTLNASAAVAVFDNMGPAENIPVTVTGYEVNGTDIANYILTQPTGLTATINDTGLANQSITFGALDAVTYSDATISLTATASSGLTVTYTSSNEDVATVSGNSVTLTGAGTTTITAFQEGNGTYNPAVAVPQELVVNKKTLTVANAAVTDKIYNGNDVAEVTGTSNGVVGTDIVILDGTGQFATVDVANGITVETVYGISGTDAGNYEVTQPGDLIGNIVPAQLTLNGSTAPNKPYDATTTAVITGTLTGIVSGDEVGYAGTGTFASADVATGIAVTATVSLTGADAGNYYLTQPSGLTADITAKAITVTATAENKQYDGLTDAVITVTAIEGVVEGDDVATTGGGAFANASVANNKPVTAALSLTGDDAGNYALTQPTGLTANITAMNLTVDVTNAVVADKIYDRTTANAVITGGAITGVAEGEDVQVVSGTYASSQVTFVNNTVTPVLSGTHAGNYTFTQVGTLTGNIVPKEATFTGASVTTRAYDGTTAATITGGSLQGVFSADVVAGVALARSGYFAPVSEADQGEDAGINKTVTSTSILTGDAASNYSLTQPTNLTGTITPRALTITGLTADNKVYDKNTTATLSGDAELAGVVNSDDVSLSGTPVANFNNFNAGSAKPVTVTGYTLAGSTDNYTLTQPGGLTANITAKPLTVEGGAVTTKTYNANTTAAITGASLTGVEAGDTVNATSGTFASANVGTHNVTVNLSGTNAANYTLTQPDPLLTGTINKAPLTITAVNQTRLQGVSNGTILTAAGSRSYATFLSSDNATDDADFTPPTLTTTAIQSSPAGAYPITFATPGDALNYELTYVTGTLIITGPETTAFAENIIWSDNIDGSNPSSSNPFTASQTVPADAYINVSGIGHGPGVDENAGNDRYNLKSWTTTLDTNAYFTFTITPVAGYELNLSQFVYTGSVSSNINTFAVRSSIDGFTTNIGSAGINGTISLTGAAYQNLTSSIEFRLYAWGASVAGGNTYSVNNFSFRGSITQPPAAPVLPVISNLASNGTTTYTMNYGAANGSFDVNVNSNATPTVTFSAAFPAGVDGKAEINASTGLITFNTNDTTILPGTYNIPVNAKSYYNSTTNPATNGDTKTLKLVVSKLNQVVTYDTDPNPLPANLQPGNTFTIEYNNTAGLPLVWASSDESVATLVTDAEGVATVTIVAAGSANITSSNAGNDIYNAYNVTAVPLAIRALAATPSPVVLHSFQGQGASMPVQLTSVTGSNLSPVSGNINFTVTGDFEVMLGVNAYTSSGSFAYSAPGGTLDMQNPQINVRMKAGLAAGQYTGTLALSGGGAVHEVLLTGEVEVAAAITTTTATYGPYCIGTQNTISTAYTTEGTFTSGNFYVQLSDAAGVFPADFSNIISPASAVSPITATLPNTMTAGLYRVRVVHVSTGLVLTVSGNDNGSDINIMALPTLTGVQAAAACAGSNSEITLTGLLPNIEVTVDYTIGAVAHTATVTANAGGTASFEAAIATENDGQLLTITGLTRTDVAPACAANFTVSAPITVSNNTWTGAAGTTDWNDEGNWSCGTVPTEDVDAVIIAGDNQPQLTDGMTVSVNSLTIEEGAEMTVMSGSNLIVTDVVIVDNELNEDGDITGGQLTIENNANLIQVNDVENSGYISVIKESAPLFRLDYAMWSAPVTGGTLKAFSPETLDNRFYHYNPVTDAYAPVAPTTPFSEGSSYLMRVDNTHPAYDAETNYEGSPWTGTFTGVPNNGNVTVQVTTAGFNAVGNPYPSPINIEAFYAANAGSIAIDAPLFFWRKKNGEEYSSYASLNLEGYTANGQVIPEHPEVDYGDASNGVFDNANESDEWVLNPGQGFIVSTSGDIVFNNGMREAVNNGQLFRTTQDASSKSRLWLNMMAVDGEFHQAMIGYSDNGTLGIDYGRDGRALTDGAVALYSLAGESKLGIQARPAFEVSDEVPMGYKATVAGSYTIALDHFDGLFAEGQLIYLRDNLLGVTHNLSEGEYSFASEAGTFAGRFDVVYADALGNETPEMDANTIIVYTQDNTIRINSGLLDMMGVTVYDLRGRILYTAKDINATETVINGIQAQEQMLIVEITTTKGKTSKKIIF